MLLRFPIHVALLSPYLVLVSFGLKRRQKRDKDFSHSLKGWTEARTVSPLAALETLDHGQGRSPGLEDVGGEVPAEGTWQERRMWWRRCSAICNSYLILLFYYQLKKNRHFYLFIFYYAMSSPGCRGLTPQCMKEDQWDYQQNPHQLDEISGIIIAAIMGLYFVFMCVWFCSVSM